MKTKELSEHPPRFLLLSGTRIERKSPMFSFVQSIRRPHFAAQSLLRISNFAPGLSANAFLKARAAWDGIHFGFATEATGRRAGRAGRL